MRILVKFVKNFRRIFVLYGIIAIVIWVAYFLVHFALGEALFITKDTPVNLWWNFHLNNPLMWLLDFFSITYCIFYAIKNE